MKNYKINFDREIKWEREIGNEQINFRFNVINILVYLIGLALIIQLFNL